MEAVGQHADSPYTRKYAGIVGTLDKNEAWPGAILRTTINTI